MTEFGVAAMLEVEVDEASLGAARRKIESSVPPANLGASTMAPRGPSARISQPRSPSTGQFMSVQGPEQRLVDLEELAGTRNELLLELIETVEQGAITEAQSGGGGVLSRAVGTGAGIRLGAGLGGLAGLGLGVPAAGFAATVGAGNLLREGNRRFLQEGERVLRGREQFTGLGGIQQAIENPGDFFVSGFKNMLDPTGIGESLAIEGLEELQEFGWPEFPDLAQEVQWPNLPDLSNEADWPDLPNLGQQMAWPEAPPWMQPFLRAAAMFGPGGGGGGGGGQGIGVRRDIFATNARGTGGTEGAFAPFGGGVNVGPVTVDVPGVNERQVEQMIDDGIRDLEERIRREVSRGR